MGNDPKDDTNQAIDFLNALDKACYGEFVVGYLNGISFGSIKTPWNVEKVYNLANTWLQVRMAIRTEGASYSTIEQAPNPYKVKGKDGRDKRNGKGSKRGSKSQRKTIDRQPNEDS